MKHQHAFNWEPAMFNLWVRHRSLPKKYPWAAVLEKVSREAAETRLVESLPVCPLMFWEWSILPEGLKPK